MLKNYLKIAWKVLLRRKFFTFISLFGISFTLMVLMVATALYDHAFGPQMPEKDLDRILFVNMMQERKDGGYQMSGPPSYTFLDRKVRTLTTPEMVSINSIFQTVNSYIDNRKLALDIKFTDSEFWQILDFEFVEGGPFGPQEVRNAQRVAVINEATRQNYFGNTTAVGKTIVADQVSYTVVGVVKDVPVLRLHSYADMWVPLSLRTEDYSSTSLRGEYFATIKAHSSSDIDNIKNEFAVILQDVERQHPEKGTKLYSYPDSIVEGFARTFLGNDDDTGMAKLYAILAAAVLLFMLLPAINLVNINISRIMERSSEIGVRKAFGATSSTIIGQFIIENIFLTLLGGLLGFLLSAGVLWLINDSGVIVYADLGLNLRVFALGLFFCLVFGLVSGVYPAYKMSRLHTVAALKGGNQ
ncbi:ABC transporter permease [Pontibacter ramchanderi]|uniref:Putative ABC transport system permease protein n=1 Tax=Pontibacter ramchanderi TaxID=1179743 RepID=A0A2N3V3D9_9BACT|nr:ABC transporter permease [Pontibacter ramchanderi]PKV76144.1 putative ABC transport system permease protein [Pontibacter ramchanderi]